MARADVPEIRSLPDAVTAGVGEGVQVYLLDEEPGIGPVRRSSNELIRDVVDEMFTREGVPRNRDLEVLCVLAARIAVKKLALSKGFTVEFGDAFEEPREVIRVVLRPDDPIFREAEVTNTTQE